MARARSLRLAKKDRSVYEVVVRARGASHIKKRPSLIGNTGIILRLLGSQMQARNVFWVIGRNDFAEARIRICAIHSCQNFADRRDFSGWVRGGERPRSDSNRRITDLQSVPLVHLGTRPRCNDIGILSLHQLLQCQCVLVSSVQFIEFPDPGSESFLELTDR